MGAEMTKAINQEEEKKEEKKEKKKREKPKYNMWQNSAFMIKLAWQVKEKKVLVTGVLAAILAVARSLTELFVAPTILGLVETSSPLKQLLSTIAFFMLLGMVLTAAENYIDANTLPGRITVRAALIAKLSKKAATTSYPNIMEEKFQTMQSRAQDTVNSNNSAGEAIWGNLFGLLQNLLGFIIYLALLSNVNPLLMVIITVITLISYRINKPLNEYWYRHREEQGQVHKRLYSAASYSENTGMAKDIRIFGMRPWIDQLFEKGLVLCQEFKRKGENVVIWGRILDVVFAFLQNGLVYAYLIYLVLQGNLSVSLFLLYFAAAGEFSAWVNGILSNCMGLYSQSLELSTTREYLEYPEPFLFEKGERLNPISGGSYELKLEDVSFRYPKSEKDTLSHINLTLHPGEKLAIVGLNGAGKTTIVKLLCGFLDPTEGRVLLNGRDIREYNRQDYYQLFSAVFQSFSLLAASVATNVTQLEDGFDRQRMEYCVEQAGLTDKINSLPEGYETKLNREVYNDATLLSGGETQRLMLARALYKDAPFVMLDEPTAALDPIAEADMYNKYYEMTKERSSVYISHRLASTRFCDRIILIEDGEITEEGTHEQLLAAGGSYAKLFEVQSKYYREGGDQDGSEE